MFATEQHCKEKAGVATDGSAISTIDSTMSEMETQDSTPENTQELSNGTQESAQELSASHSVPENVQELSQGM